MEPARIEHIDTPEGRILWREMLGVLPGLQAILNFVTEKQSAAAPGRLFWYQTELFERWFFRIPSPHTGCMIHSGDSWTGDRQATFFRFPDAADVVLASYGSSEGFPIDALLFTTPISGCVSGVAFGVRDFSPLTDDISEAFQAFSMRAGQNALPLSSATAILANSSLETARAHMLAKEIASLKNWRQPVTFSIRQGASDPSFLPAGLPAAFHATSPPDNRARHVSFCV